MWIRVYFWLENRNLLNLVKIDIEYYDDFFCLLLLLIIFKFCFVIFKVKVNWVYCVKGIVLLMKIGRLRLRRGVVE